MTLRSRPRDPTVNNTVILTADDLINRIYNHFVEVSSLFSKQNFLHFIMLGEMLSSTDFMGSKRSFSSAKTHYTHFGVCRHSLKSFGTGIWIGNRLDCRHYYGSIEDLESFNNGTYVVSNKGISIYSFIFIHRGSEPEICSLVFIGADSGIGKPM